jgi:methyltransferase
MTADPSFAWVPAAIVLQRVFELLLCLRNRRIMGSLGGREFFARSYLEMVALHSLFIASLALESFPWRIPLDGRTWGSLAALALVTSARYWTIASLGDRWTTRIFVVPGDAVKRKGPYRFLRHPNYAVIVLEFLLFPLLLRAPLTLVLFSAANLAVLRRRIRREESALREWTDYGRKFPGS